MWRYKLNEVCDTGNVKREIVEIRAIDRKQWLIERAEEDIIEKIKKLEARNDEVIKVVEEMKKIGVKVLRNKKWQIKDNLVLKEGKVYVLRDEKLRVEIIQLHNNIPITGHGKQ